MKSLARITLLLSLTIVLFFGCKHEPLIPDIDFEPMPTGDCDPDTVYFEKDILPLLIGNCAISGCHDAVTREDGVQLTDYKNVISTGRVVAFQPGESEIFEVITETDPDDVMPPPPNDRLNAAQIAIIEKWIIQGARNWTCTPVGCDTNDVRYSNLISPLIQNKCAGCHGATNPQAGLSLVDHSQVQSVALDGRLINSLKGINGFQLMPQGGPALPDCEIAQIEMWIADGAPDN